MKLVIWLITSLKPDFCTALNMHNGTDNNYVLSHAQNTTAVQPNIFLKAIHLLLFKNKGRSPFPRAKKYQGQLQTPQ
jgi:hypothetical protein